MTAESGSALNIHRMLESSMEKQKVCRPCGERYHSTSIEVPELAQLTTVGLDDRTFAVTCAVPVRLLRCAYGLVAPRTDLAGKFATVANPIQIVGPPEL